MKPLPISVVILTKNNQRTIEKVLNSLICFAEVVVLDTGSTDQTLPFVTTFSNTQIFHSPFTGFGLLRNHAATFASHDWILALDSDEVLSFSLLQELQELKLNPDHIYSMPFHNYYNGKWIKCCGWYPDRHTRLYHRRKTSFSSAEVHEGLLLDNVSEVKLHGAIEHYSYASVEDFLDKMQRYSDLFAKQHQGKRSSSFRKALGHGLFAFFKNYFLQKGWLYGREGFLIAHYNATTTFYKYLKLAEANQRLQR